jgi:vacuolar-type H+-ATPase subunit I/STV1
MKLEKFVQENRAAFDDKFPSAMLWENISDKLNEIETEKPEIKVISLRSRVYRYVSIAAIGLVLLTVGGLIGSYLTQQQQGDNLTFGAINEEYEELENFYSQKVNTKVNELKKYRFDENIIEDIDELDIAFVELKKELKKQNTDIDNEEIIDEMIANYQTKIEILERVLNRLERKQTEQEKIKKDGKVSL